MLNKKIKILGVTAICLCLTLTGCSGSFMDVTGKKASNDSTSEMDKSKLKKVDESLEVPNFTTNLSGTIQVPVDIEGNPITVEASVSDGGEISYQWYRNNVNSNGGGEAIDGATTNSLTPHEKEEGTDYYYVVATNTKGDGVRMASSATIEVQIIPQGQWVDDGSGFRKYQMFDGSYVTNDWKEIGGHRYSFNGDANMRHSEWFQDGDGSWYYLNPDGIMATDTEIDGYAIDSEGKSEAKKQAEEQAAQDNAAGEEHQGDGQEQQGEEQQPEQPQEAAQ